jgi:hypothetical protein
VLPAAIKGMAARHLDAAQLLEDGINGPADSLL